MGKSVAILQSNYIPWKGYFDIIGMVDEFILYDTAQYTKNDWRNRNQIKTANGVQWLTIPVHTKGQLERSIQETLVMDHIWAKKHFRTLSMNYAKAPCKDEILPWLENCYTQAASLDYLSEINRLFLQTVCDFLGITTKITFSSDYPLVEGKTKRLVELVRAAGGDTYLSGPAAKDYIEDALFEESGVALQYMDYADYPPYPQLYDDFTHNVSILDLLFMCGKDAPKYMKWPEAHLS